jgi:hypothetical protein
MSPMDDPNPYAPSRASLGAGERVPAADRDAGHAVWRYGDVLIMLIGAEMPGRCVKCNGPPDQPTRRRKVYWHHPALYGLLLFNVLIYAIVALVVRKRATVHAGLCIEHKKQRRIALILAWAAAISGIVLVLFGIGGSSGMWGAWVGVLLILGASIAGRIFGRVVYARKIDKTHVYLKGCGTAFLDSLPPFSG